MFFLNKCALGAAMAFGLAGCEVPVMIAADANGGQMTGMFEITFPAALLVQTADGNEEFLTGDLRGYANGNSNFSFTGPTYGKCEGSSTSAGDMVMSCDNGLEWDHSLGRQRAKMTGTFVLDGTSEGIGYVGAMGWGNDANEAAVRLAIAEAQAG
ncbi:hypothetical protein [Yoonia sp.]|uniref:hypothetical protein n=1 Tax=Yoonia sp. TaxID=2212373 RepID=UPI0025F4147A|nr:hypothetical protein [Yoonia sp.]